MPGLTFSAAVRTNLLLIAAYATAALAGAIAAPVAIYSLFVLVCANLIGGAGCCALEYANRGVRRTSPARRGRHARRTHGAAQSRRARGAGRRPARRAGGLLQSTG
ncbi:MAG: hypothetical protein E6K27_15300 [Gammaproteobacteria bacterium]|nr:MAG: hypothetical protein E6K27_15300 [Gammaproteobacteria bacterium]